MTKTKHIHFMGIGGSGMSGAALLAHSHGYKVTGCDLEEQTDYLNQFEKTDITVFAGHDQKHLKGVDILITSPALMFQKDKPAEYESAMKKIPIMTWQKFLGENLQRNKKVISITGTHGKSTTTAMAALLFEQAGKDPEVMIGAKIRKWGQSYRTGKSKYFIIEADEFYDNFLNYSSETIVVNNIEFDHPDFFESEGQVVESFVKFIKKITGEKNLIINQDSPGIKKVFDVLPDSFLNTLNIYGYTLSDSPILQIKNSVYATNIIQKNGKTQFKINSKGSNLSGEFILNAFGTHNVYNSLGVIILGKIYGIKLSEIKKSLFSFDGINRRMEFIGGEKGIKVYDDYAHHPTAVCATINALRQNYSRGKIVAVVEPHSFSRTNALLKNYKNVFEKASRVIIGPIFKARDTSDFGISGQSIVDIAEHKNIKYLKTLKTIISEVKKGTKKGDIIIVMGAGKSYLWAREILKNL